MGARFCYLPFAGLARTRAGRLGHVFQIPKQGF
jgi:hypothetical protein